MFSTCLENVRARTPLVHSITNYVTVNDVANILLACGGSPIMSDDIGEVEEIASICGGVNINIGTLSQRTIPAMFAAGKRANALSRPVLLDPVGAGASALRTRTALPPPWRRPRPRPGSPPSPRRPHRRPPPWWSRRPPPEP